MGTPTFYVSPTGEGLEIPDTGIAAFERDHAGKGFHAFDSLESASQYRDALKASEQTTPPPVVDKTSPEYIAGHRDLTTDDYVTERGMNVAPAPSIWESFTRAVRNPSGLSDEIAKGVNTLMEHPTSVDVGYGTPTYEGTSAPIQSTPRQIGRGMNQPLDPRGVPQIAADEEKRVQAQAELAHPYVSGAARAIPETALMTLAGGLGGAAAAAPAAETVNQAILRRAIPQAKIGAGAGAASGYGYSEDPTLSGQALDTGLATLAGAVTAPVMSEFPLIYGRAKGEAGVLPPPKVSKPDWAERRALQQVKEQLGPGTKPSLTDHPDDITPWFAENLKRNPESRSIAFANENPRIAETQRNELANKISDLEKLSDEIQAEEDISKKGQQVVKYLRQGGTNPVPAIQATDQLITGFEQQVEALRPRLQKGLIDSNKLERVSNNIRQYHKTVAESPGQGPEAAADRYMAADQVKRALQQMVKVNPDSPAIDAARSMSDQVMNHLQDPDLWGSGPAANQARRNTAWREHLMNPKEHDAFLTETGAQAASDPYDKLRIGNIEGVEKTLQTAGKDLDLPRSETAYLQSPEASLRRMVDSKAKLGDALTDHIDPDPIMRAKAQRMGQLRSEINDILDTRVRQNMASEQIKRIENVPPQTDLLSKLPQVTKPVLGGAGLGAAGAIAAGHPGVGMAALAAAPLAYAADKIEQSTPAAYIGRIRNQVRLEAQAPTNPAAQKALDRLGVGWNLRPLAPAAEKSLETVGSPGYTAYTVDQTGQALRDWARSNPDKGEGNTRGQDSTQAVEYMLANNPEVFGPYLDQLRKSPDVAKELFKLQSDPQWVKNVQPHLHNLTSSQ